MSEDNFLISSLKPGPLSSILGILILFRKTRPKTFSDPLHDIMIFWILCLDHDKWQIKNSNFTAVSLCCFTLSTVFSLVLSLILRSVPIFIVFQLLLGNNPLEQHTIKNPRMDCKVEKEIWDKVNLIHMPNFVVPCSLKHKINCILFKTWRMNLHT